MTTPATVALRDLSVRRGGREVLRVPALDVAAGAVTGLLGPSGCGKTTLMRCLVGVQRAVSGEVTVLGAPAGTPALRPRVGYLTQSPSVYGDLTVRENLEFFARVAGVGPGRVDAVIEAVAVPVRGRQLVRDLSGGECARVSLAAVLLGDPELLVLDEPTVGLDPLLRAELWRAFAALAAGGTTLLVSSHSMEEARHCDRLVLMREGEVLLSDTPGGLRARTGRHDLEDAFVTLIAGRAEAA
ncbi:ABC transporter ATP-binding protein [Baekduia soli]|uniref:ABC transporter ATP-binding protein n=1 Tax=Baekduia soli TaxID=496014 RepID=A0A5B8U7Q4_9ACTN|nr:ABC transporter ATP-binding protein [Baekduia soli]QEC48838.1 ABC transporter ATP-binding protein [Baekduia soli]